MSKPLLLGCLFSSVLLLAGCDRESVQLTLPPPQVSVVTLHTEPLTLTRELPGRVTSSLVAEVRPQVTGIIKERLFTEGSAVAAGQPLYQLDDATYRAELNSARASLARAQAIRDAAKRKANRAQELIKTRAISQQDYDDAMAAMQQAEAEVGVAEAEVVRREVVLGYTLIRSPIAGFIGKSKVTAGALVTVNQDEALATVQQLDPIYVDLTQTSAELLELRKRFASSVLRQAMTLPVQLMLEDGSEYGQPGSLAFAEVSLDPSTSSLALRVVVPNEERVLLPGMYVRAKVSSAERQDALLVPQKAVTRDPKGKASVLVLGEGDRVEVRQVTVSQTVGDQWLVEAGLAPGDDVIVAGFQRIRPGMEVAVTRLPPQAATQSETAMLSSQSAAAGQ